MKQEIDPLIDSEFNDSENSDSKRRLTTLDFNADRQGIIPTAHRFSTSQFREQLEKMDLYDWGRKLEFPENDYYSYPANLDKAELHRQCHYLQPDAEFLQRTDAQGCPCCGKSLRRERYNVFFKDMYDAVAKEHGIVIPLYFSFMKLQILVQIVIFLVYGLFFLIQAQRICEEYNKDKQILPVTDDTYDPCQFHSFYRFIDMSNFLWYMSKYKEKGYDYFHFAAFAVLLANLMMPFFYEILIRYRQLQYWDTEPINHLHEDKKSVYVKHLPYKMTQKEIQITIQKALAFETHKMLAKKSYLFEQEDTIEEIVYVYDIHEINEKNQKREELFTNMLITLRQLTELRETGSVTTRTDLQIKQKQVFDYDLLQNLLKDQLRSLMFQTQEIKMYLKNGLPFTNKVLIKFQTYDQRQAAYLHYQKSWYQNLLIRYEVLKEQHREEKKKKTLIVDAQTARTISVDSMSYDNYQVQNLSEKRESEPPQEKTTLQALQDDYSNKYVEQNHQRLRVHRGFRTHEIFWENLGMNTLHRLKYRIRALVTIFITLLVLMGGFELIYYYQTSTKQKQRGGYVLGPGQKVLTIFFTVLVSIISPYSTLSVMRNLNNSRRSTYTEVEVSIMHVFVFLQYVLVNFLPYILTLELWNGEENVVTIYDLVSLYQTRLITKQIFHTFHIRHSKFWLRKRKALKNFMPHLYFQGQLNALMTPPTFPIRGRTYNLLTLLTVSLTMIYVCPIIVVVCLAINIYLFFLDKHTINKNYQIDKKYNIEHLSYVVKSYQFVLLPFNIYIFMRLFWGFGWLAKVGAPVSALFVILLAFGRRPVVRFIVTKILRQSNRKVHNPEFKEEPYFKSYEKYFQSLRIEKLTEQLATIFTKTIKGKN